MLQYVRASILHRAMPQNPVLFFLNSTPPCVLFNFYFICLIFCGSDEAVRR